MYLMSISSSLTLQAYIHTRMRAKTSDFLKVLNRARPDAEKKEMKTISYVASFLAVSTSFIRFVSQTLKTFIEDEQDQHLIEVLSFLILLSACSDVK